MTSGRERKLLQIRHFAKLIRRRARQLSLTTQNSRSQSLQRRAVGWADVGVPVGDGDPGGGSVVRRSDAWLRAHRNCRVARHAAGCIARQAADRNAGSVARRRQQRRFLGVRVDVLFDRRRILEPAGGHLRRERAAYEVDRACRQYQACEPENRLVARELERLPEQDLEKLLRYLRSLKDGHAENAVATLAAESALAKDWLTPEEDAAWQNL